MERKREKKRGRPRTYPDHFYLVLFLFLALITTGLTGRQRLSSETSFLTNLAQVFQTLNWYMRKKLKEKELHKLLNLLKDKLRPFLEKSPLLILDSTGIPKLGKTVRA